MDRREFMKTGALAALGAATLAPEVLAAPTVDKVLVEKPDFYYAFIYPFEREVRCQGCLARSPLRTFIFRSEYTFQDFVIKGHCRFCQSIHEHVLVDVMITADQIAANRDELTNGFSTSSMTACVQPTLLVFDGKQISAPTNERTGQTVYIWTPPYHVPNYLAELGSDLYPWTYNNYPADFFILLKERKLFEFLPGRLIPGDSFNDLCVMPK